MTLFSPEGNERERGRTKGEYKRNEREKGRTKGRESGTKKKRERERKKAILRE